MTTTRPPLRDRLANGLRLVLDPMPGRARVVVGLTVGVGFRHERPGQEGLAHLAEHLLFEGSAAVPAGCFRPPVHRLGGLVNGTTHQDYTEFHQVAPPEALERMLFTDADRLRAPVITPETLAEQLAVVTAEIADATGPRRLGGLPWPRLPRALFTAFADAHDGYGDPRRLAEFTVADCQDFVAEHYHPANAVLTVAGDLDPDRTRALIERMFGDLPARPVPPAPDRSADPLDVSAAALPGPADAAVPGPSDAAVPGPSDAAAPGLSDAAAPGLSDAAVPADRWQQDVADLGGLPTVVAAGVRLPDDALPRPGRPMDETTLQRYAAALVVATAVGHRQPSASAGVGFFGPLDARTPDVLVVSGAPPAGAAGPDWWADIRGLLHGWASGQDDDLDLPALQRALQADLLGPAEDLVERGRALGRGELLFARPDLVDALPTAVGAVTRDGFAAAAAALAREPVGGVEIRPDQALHPDRTEPDSARTDRNPGVSSERPAGATLPVPTPRRSAASPADPVALPPLAPARAFRVDARAASDDGGTRVVMIPPPPGARPRRAHVAARWPWGRPGWAHPGAADAAVHRLRARLVRADLPVQVGTDGQWLTLTAAGNAARLPGTLAAMAAAVRDTAGDRAAAAPLPRSPAWLADDVRRRLLLGPDRRPAGSAPRTVGPGEVLAGLRPGAVAIVGADPTGELSGALEALRRIGTVEAPGPTTAQPLSGSTAAEDLDLIRVPLPGAERVQIALTAWTPRDPASTGGADEAAAYLATAVFGSWFDSRLARRGRAGGWTPLLGRDVLLDRPRVFLRADVDPAQVDRVLADLAAEQDAVLGEPFTGEEIEAARTYCRAQLRSIADAPAGLAAAVAAGLAAGRPLDWPDDLADALARVDGERVRVAARELFTTRPFGGVLLGAVAADAAPIGRR